MTTTRKPTTVDRESLREHLSAWLNDPQGYTVSLEDLAVITGKVKRNVKRDVKRLMTLKNQPIWDGEFIHGSDFVTLLASYQSAVSFIVVDTLAELYAEQQEQPL